MAHGRHHHHNHNPAPEPDPSPTPDPNPTPDPPTTTPAPDFATLGLTFNDATRALVGGLWQNAVEEGAQGLGSVFRYASDLQTVTEGLQAEIAAGQFTGDTLTNVQTIINDLATASAAATASVNGGGTFGSVAAAEKALHDAHIDILNIVNGDDNLAALATANGAAGFLAAPPTLADGVAAADAPHANLAEIGVIFNDLANRTLGGVNAENAQAATDDVNALIADMQQLVADQPLLFGGLTGVHADAVIRQLQLELTYIKQAGVSPDAGRASNDNLLDIIDIVQGDTNLANMASQGGLAGFTPFGDALQDTPRYQDNDAQTTFWATFIAQSNSLGQQAIELVNSGDDAAIATLINDLHSFQKYVTDFDAAQGGIFQARFDNELLGETSTLGAEVSKMIEGLNTGNAALVGAAAEQMHANSADVGGNNIPVTGGEYNPDGLTVAEVLSTAGTPAAAAAVPAAAAPAAAVSAASAAPAASTTATTTAAASHDADDVPTADHAAFHHHQMDAHVFAQLWHHA